MIKRTLLFFLTLSLCLTIFSFIREDNSGPEKQKIIKTIIVDAGSPISARNLSRQPVPYLSDAERLAQPMGQFQSWCGKLFTYSSEFIGWRYTKGLV